MSTNDTLRGRELLLYIHGKLTMREMPSEAALVDIADRIDAALAEPVTGGVVLPERKEWVGPTWQDMGDAHADGYNQALDDVAALNGGAVAGRVRNCEYAGCCERANPPETSLCERHQEPAPAQQPKKHSTKQGGEDE